MTIQVTVPQLGESVMEATVGKWLVQPGERVEKGQPLVEILTDKADTEVVAPAAGVLVQVLRAEDETVTPGDVIAEIDESASAEAPSPKPGPAAAAPASSGGDGEDPVASPAVRQLARELGVDLAGVRGSGKGGRITADDVRALAKQPAEAEPAPSSTGAASPAPAPGAPAAEAPRRAVPPPAEQTRPMWMPPTGPMGAFRLPPYVAREGDEVVPFTRRRRIIADHMLYSKRVSPEVVTFAECDLHRTWRLREQHKAAAKRDGLSLSFTAFAAAATAKALKEFPNLNARVLEDAFVRLREVNLGIAVDTEQGLVVPVVRHADELTVRGISRAIDELAQRARSGELTPDDLADKTFTLSNPGRRGNLVGGAIISQPNVGILRMGTIKKRPVVVERDGDEHIAIHPVMYMALTYDHRIVDGVEANGFLYRVVEILEQADFEL